MWMVSGVHQGESVIHTYVDRQIVRCIYIHLLFKWVIANYQVDFPVLYSRFSLIIFFIQ